MIKSAKRAIRGMYRALGYDIVPYNKASEEFPPDFDSEMRDVFERLKPFTMTSKERVFALCKSVEYVVKHQIPGDIVECGVWKGGSMMAVAQTLTRLEATRKLYLFDTFEGMSEPTDVDRNIRGKLAADLLKTGSKETSWWWVYSSLDEVRQNMSRVEYDERDIVFVKGKVEDTIPVKAPDRISLLRLDTDWYESTYHELQHLWPRLSVGGVLIIDDYGHWEGARKAVEQYIEENHLKILLNRIDYTGRVCVKVEA